MLAKRNHCNTPSQHNTKLITHSIELSYLIPFVSLKLKFLGQHEGSIVELQKPLLVETGVQVVDGLVDVIDATLQISAQTLLARHMGQEGSGYTAVKSEVHAL